MKEIKFDLSIKINSNWGNESLVGLNELKLFDKNFQEIYFDISNIKLEYENKELKTLNLKNICNGLVNNFNTNYLFHMPFEAH